MDEVERRRKKEQLKQIRKAISNYKRDRNKIFATNALKTFILWSPTTVGIVTAIGYYKTNNISPFALDYVEKQAYTTTSYSSNTGVVEKYIDYAVSKPLDDDIMIYYGPWVKQDDGTYLYITKEYVLNNITEEQAQKLLSKEDLTWDDLSILSVQSCKVTDYRKNTVTEEELKRDPYFELKVYDCDKNNTIIAKETWEENHDSAGMLAAFALVTGLAEVSAHVIGVATGILPYEKTGELDEKIKKLEVDKKIRVNQLKK